MTVTKQRYPEGTEPGWEVIESHVPPNPMPNYGPRVWKGKEIISRLYDVAETIKLGPKALRRNFALVNPPLEASSHTIYFSMQLVNPGEEAPTHRHTASACRFMIKGKAATIVNGIKFDMEEGDLVLTPSWSWHGHINETKEPAVWLDILDWPVPKLFHATFSQEPEGSTKVLMSGDDLDYARAADVYPSPMADFQKNASFPYAWKWKKVDPVLHRSAQIGDGDPYDGVSFTYVHPYLGEQVSNTMSASVHLLKPGSQTKAHRHTPVGLYYVVQGDGTSIINGKEYHWETNDAFVVPTWHWHEHRNNSKQKEAILMRFTDEPILKMLGLNRKETKA